MRVVFEEGTWATWLYDLLKSHVTEVLVCNTRKNAVRKGSKKPKPHSWPHDNTTFRELTYIRWCCIDLSNALEQIGLAGTLSELCYKDCYGASEVLRNIRFILALIAISMTACTSRKVDFEQVLARLPADTESLLVANGPFWMSNFQMGQEVYTNHKVTSEELEKHFEGMTLQLFNFGNGLLEKHLRGKKVLLALEGSRHFRPPAGLGELPFEGCAVAIFEDNHVDRRDVFMKEAAQKTGRIEEIEGQRVAIFEEAYEQDIWRIYIAFPQKGVVLAATNEQFLREMLSRMRSPERERALPSSLPEWKYVNARAQFWGVRHFDKQRAREDPTSPFGGRKSANLPDDDAIGLTYESSPSKERRATLTYLSSSGNVGKIEEGRFPSSSEPENTAGLHIQRRELQPGVIQSTYDLSRSLSLNWFFFVFIANVGHAIYI